MTLKDLDIAPINPHNPIIITIPHKSNTDLGGLPPFNYIEFSELIGDASGICPRLVFINY